MDTWNYELNCKWSFPDMPDNGSIVGPNEPMTENFKKTPYASLVREAIQNSLDERLDKTKPLEMNFPSKSPNFSIRIPRKDLAGNITFNAYVSVKEPIHNYHNSGFNSDYGDSSFDMESGDILVGFPEVKHHIDIKYDKLQAAGSFMIIHEDCKNSVVNFAFDHDKIDINIPTPMFVQYQNGLKTNFAEMMHASLAFNALTCALYELPKIYSDSNGSLLWIQAIVHRLQTEEQFEGMLDAQTMEISDVPAVANLLLKDPYKRLFDYLTEQIANDIEDDNG